MGANGAKADTRQRLESISVEGVCYADEKSVSYRLHNTATVHATSVCSAA